MQLWNKPKISVFANSWRRSRVTLIDKRFKTICNKSNDYNPFSDEIQEDDSWHGQCRAIWVMWNNSKGAMFRMFFYWNQGAIYCTCGHILVASGSSQHFSQWRLDLLSFPHRFINKVRLRGARHGKMWGTKRAFRGTRHGGGISKRIMKEFTIASNEIQHTVIRMEQISTGKFKERSEDMGNAEFFELFGTSPITQSRESFLYCNQGIVSLERKWSQPRRHWWWTSWISHNRTGEVCFQMDALALKHFSYHMTEADYFRRSVKQNAISLSSCEAEFYAAKPVLVRENCWDSLNSLRKFHDKVSVRHEVDWDSARHNLQRRGPGGF